MTVILNNIISTRAAAYRESYARAAKSFGCDNSFYQLKSAEELPAEFFSAFADFRIAPASPEVRANIRDLMPLVVAELTQRATRDMARLSEDIKVDLERRSISNERVTRIFLSKPTPDRMFWPHESANYNYLNADLKDCVTKYAQGIHDENVQLSQIILGSAHYVKESDFQPGQYKKELATEIHVDASASDQDYLNFTWRALALPTGFVGKLQQKELISHPHHAEILERASRGKDTAIIQMAIDDLEKLGYAHRAKVGDVNMFMTGRNGTLHYSSALEESERNDGVLSVFHKSGLMLPQLNP